MKTKISVLIILCFVAVFAATGCMKSQPSGPGDTSTPTINPTLTAEALQTAGPAAQQTATAQSAATTITVPTAIITPIGGSSAIVSVPGRTFIQSDPYGNSFSHTISAFKMGKYQVTYNLWYAVYQWAVGNGYSFANAGAGSGYAPVTTVNWRDVIVWCNAYSQKSGLTPVYCSDPGLTTPIKNSTNGVYGSSINTTAGSFDNPYVNWNTNGYRLPTEGEWQYAASYIDGSSWTPYNYASGATADYNDATATRLVAWYYVNCNGTQVVGGKTANALGIYDMSGNVWEWCWDWGGAYPGTYTDYRGSASGSVRVIRGGGFYDDAEHMQVGFRYSNYADPYGAYYDSGFRFARTN